MKLTKRGFLQSIGSAFAAGAVADKAQLAQRSLRTATAMAASIPTPANWSIGGAIGGIGAQCQSFMPVEWSWPSWKAKERAEFKRRFLRDADPAMRRSGQFTSHEQKKQRWLMKREYRRFMSGPWNDHCVETIHQWKQQQTVLGTLEDLRGRLEALQQANPTPRR